ncbi:glutamate ABC transporter substrate-binding protein [Mobilicoccus caccae]|uniref:Glutamate-binding protein n=1 Tax=Mobilicoccus caccae TaxID=1859295 RepID=A0ABQ6ISX9_9MICO|nr:glutamate ABC transporter substrate-binding protein [Mobilicoccus caccae]GMA40156.1 glutamate-binding protein [Mobilicoccus caccae]
MKHTPFGILATTCAAALALSACGAGTSGGGQPGGGASGGGDALRVGIKFDQPGMGLKKGEEYSGFDVDVARYVAKELGKTPQFSEAPSPQRETLLKTGQLDMIVATYSITDKRKNEVGFAGPYFIAGQDLLVRTDENAIKGPDTLTGKKLCSVKGSTPAQKVKDEHPDVQLQEYDTYSKCVEELVNGTVDALTTDDTILAGYASQEQYSGKLKVVGNTFSEEKYGIGLPKDNADMCQKVTDALKKMIDSGEWQKIVDANFGQAGFKPGPGNPPTPAACG